MLPLTSCYWHQARLQWESRKKRGKKHSYITSSHTTFFFFFLVKQEIQGLLGTPHLSCTSCFSQRDCRGEKNGKGSRSWLPMHKKHYVPQWSVSFTSLLPSRVPLNLKSCMVSVAAAISSNPLILLLPHKTSVCFKAKILLASWFYWSGSAVCCGLEGGSSRLRVKGHPNLPPPPLAPWHEPQYLHPECPSPEAACYPSTKYVWGKGRR